MQVRGIVWIGVALCAALAFGQDCTRDVGLVLSGGGAKGAYEVGVWQAIYEAEAVGRIGAISGTSVGSINATLFASVSDTRICERFWLEVVPYFCKPKSDLSEVMGVEKEEGIAAIKDRLMEEKAKQFRLKVSDLSVADEEEALAAAVREWKRKASIHAMNVVADGIESFMSTNDVLVGFADGDNFRRLLAERIPDKWAFDNVSVYATAVEKGAWRKSVFRVDKQPKERILDILIASSGIPCLYDSQNVCGKLYIDGGWEVKGGDNVPIAPILDNHPEIKTIIVVYLVDETSINPMQRDRVRRAARRNNVRLIEILPSEYMGGMAATFDNRPETARRLIELGRKDACKVFKEMKMTSQEILKGEKK